MLLKSWNEIHSGNSRRTLRQSIGATWHSIRRGTVKTSTTPCALRALSAQGVELAVCIASGIKRGVLSEEERARYEKTSNSLAEPFTLVGLGQLISAINEADRYIEFPA